MDRVFGDIPIETAPKWQSWVARVLGKTIHKESGYVFKVWRKNIWVFGE